MARAVDGYLDRVAASGQVPHLAPMLCQGFDGQSLDLDVALDQVIAGIAAVYDGQ